MMVNLVTLAALMTLLVVVNVPVIVPVMTIVGPLMVAQYGYWYRRRRPERTMQEYLQAEPLSSSQRFLRRTLLGNRVNRGKLAPFLTKYVLVPLSNR